MQTGTIYIWPIIFTVKASKLNLNTTNLRLRSLVNDCFIWWWRFRPSWPGSSDSEVLADQTYYLIVQLYSCPVPSIMQYEKLRTLWHRKNNTGHLHHEQYNVCVCGHIASDILAFSSEKSIWCLEFLQIDTDRINCHRSGEWVAQIDTVSVRFNADQKLISVNEFQLGLTTL